MMNKKIVVLGAGESGLGAAYLAKKKGFDVFLSDIGMIADIQKNKLTAWGIEFEEGKHTEATILTATEVIKSPGIPDSAAIIQHLIQQQIPIISEIEFAARYTVAKKICITGSNGKSTTTMLIYHILKKAGLNVGLAGNIGKSFAYQVATENFDVYVLELSSFMLDNMFDFKAEIAVLLNITPDHLDRYQYEMKKYIDSKFRIVQNQTATDCFIFCEDDAATVAGLDDRNIRSKRYPFTLNNHPFAQGAWIENEQMIIQTSPKDSFTMSIRDLSLQGKHNVYNSMASTIVAKVSQIREETIRESLSDFQNIPHRLEFVAKVADVTFINDSKATNVNSTWFALESMKNEVILILGGVDKGNDYSMLKSLVKDKVKAIVCLGKNNNRIHEAFEGDVEVIVNTFSANDAVQVAYHLAQKGDTVLLSPACASFDLFKNYEDRGEQFKQAVTEL